MAKDKEKEKKSKDAKTSKKSKDGKSSKKDASKPKKKTGGGGGVTINIVERRTTDLHIAAKKGETQRMKIMIDAGVKVDVMDKDGATALHHAAYLNHPKIVKMLLKGGANVDAVDNDGCSALHNAAFGGHTECINLLLAAGANPDLKDGQHGTPMLNACSEGHVEAAKALLKKNANTSIPDDRGATPLHYACYYGHEAIVKLLIEKDGKVDVKDNDGATPLHHACANGHVKVIKLLLKQPNINLNDTDNSGTTPLHFAAYNSHAASVSALLQHAKENYKMDLRSVMLNCKDKEGSTPVHKAAFRGDANILTLFIESGADINVADKEQATPLHKAAFKGNAAILRILLERKAKMDIKDKQGGTALYNACYGGFVRCVQLLLEKEGAAEMINICDNDGRSPLHATSCFGHWECTSLLVKNKADLNVQDKDDMTPLHLAAFNGCNLSMTFLVDSGANVKLYNKEGIYPLHYASYKGHITTVHNLVEKGADVNCIDNKCNTPMFYAAARNNWDIVAYLVHRGAEVDYQNKEGLTPLTYAVKNKQIDAAITLIERGADPDLKDKYGNSPRKLCKSGGSNPVAKILRAIGKRPFSPEVLAQLSDFRTPASHKKTERGESLDAMGQGGSGLEAMISDKLMSVSSPFTEFGFNFDLNDPGELAESVFNLARNLNHQWTVLNILRLLLLIPEDEMNGRKMWNLIEMFCNQIVMNDKSSTTKISFSEFLKEWKTRKEPPRMKKLEMLGSCENALPIMFPSMPPADEFTDVTFVVEGMAGIQARQEFVDTDAFGNPVAGGGQKRVVRKVVRKVKKKKKDGTGADGEDEYEEVEEEVEEEDYTAMPGGASGGKPKGLTRRAGLGDEDEEDDMDMEEQYAQFMNYDAGLSWATPAAGAGGPPPPPGGGGPPPPPPMMGGGPPPPPPMMGGGPPPPPMMGQQKPKMKLRKLNWKKIPKGKLADSVFRHLKLQGVKLDIPMLIEYFRIPDEDKKKKKKSKKKEKTQVLDMKRQQFVGLLLSMLKMDFKAIRKAIIQCEDDKFTEDHVKAFLKLVPQKEEVEALQPFVGASAEVLATLGDAERFYLAILDIPRLESRMSAFLYKRMFDEQYQRLKEDVDAASHAITGIRNSGKFTKFLELILAIGNFLNQGSFAGGAFGFTLDSILKLEGTRSPVKLDYSIMNYLAFLTEKSFPKLLTLPEDFAMMDKGGADYMTSIQLEYADMRGGLLNMQRELEIVNKDAADPPDPFGKKMSKFFEYAKGEMKKLTADVEQLNADNKDMIDYFASGKDVDVPTVCVEFCRHFEAAVRQNQEREEKLAKAAERKKRGKLKNKGTTTKSERKDLMPGSKKKGMEVGSDEEIEEIIEEISGDEYGSDEEVIIEEEIEEVTDSEDEDD
eukprot:TRINITY_DN55_c0_g1_i1.p1 TRINITY_DN55_c0_g1~~TRINITY_DN55_c0_g1_i1.p1  ORF type:complete len:1380 (+),score=805.61 TRINITY_DN55_c0_g1_i1:131-4270(+)